MKTYVVMGESYEDFKEAHEDVIEIEERLKDKIIGVVWFDEERVSLFHVYDSYEKEDIERDIEGFGMHVIPEKNLMGDKR